MERRNEKAKKRNDGNFLVLRRKTGLRGLGAESFGNAAIQSSGTGRERRAWRGMRQYADRIFQRAAQTEGGAGRRLQDQERR